MIYINSIEKSILFCKQEQLSFCSNLTLTLGRKLFQGENSVQLCSRKVSPEVLAKLGKWGCNLNLVIFTLLMKKYADTPLVMVLTTV